MGLGVERQLATLEESMTRGKREANGAGVGLLFRTFEADDVRAWRHVDLGWTDAESPEDFVANGDDESAFAEEVRRCVVLSAFSSVVSGQDPILGNRCRPRSRPTKVVVVQLFPFCSFST